MGKEAKGRGRDREGNKQEKQYKANRKERSEAGGKKGKRKSYLPILCYPISVQWRFLIYI